MNNWGILFCSLGIESKIDIWKDSFPGNVHIKSWQLSLKTPTEQLIGISSVTQYYFRKEMPFNQVSFQLPLPPMYLTRTSKDQEGDDEEEVEEEGGDEQEVEEISGDEQEVID